MGLPCTGKSALYRNPLSEVASFLNKYHAGDFKLYNLCTRAHDLYDPEKFDGRVASFPFEDHGVPKLEHVEALTNSVRDWLAPSRSRVVCIHCLAGKGRTGLMVCAALMKLGIFSSGREAMAFYGEKRMKNKKGVTQASQRRWVEYYEQLLHRTVDVGLRRTLMEVSVRLEDAQGGKGSTPSKGSSRAAAEGSAHACSLRVLDGDGAVIGDSGPLTNGTASVHVVIEADACFMLVDAEGKELAQMWLHAGFIDQREMRCDASWWDIERHHKGAKKLLKQCTVNLLFEDDGTFGLAGQGGGQTWTPCTDSETRRRMAMRDASLAAPEMTVGDDDDDDDVDTEEEIEAIEGNETMERERANKLMGTAEDSARLEELDAMLAGKRGQRFSLPALSSGVRRFLGWGATTGEVTTPRTSRRFSARPAAERPAPLQNRRGSSPC